MLTLRRAAIVAMILLAVGFATLMFGFVYDSVFVGIPYQDPTAELSANYEAGRLRVQRIFWVGSGIMSAGAVSALVIAFLALWHLFRAKELQED